MNTTNATTATTAMIVIICTPFPLLCCQVFWHWDPSVQCRNHHHPYVFGVDIADVHLRTGFDRCRFLGSGLGRTRAPSGSAMVISPHPSGSIGSSTRPVIPRYDARPKCELDCCRSIYGSRRPRKTPTRA